MTWKTLVTIVVIPLVLVVSYFVSFIAIGEHYDIAVVTAALACGILAPSLFAMWTGAGWRAAAEGVAIGLGLAVLGSGIGIAVSAPYAISAGALGGIVLSVRWARRYLSLR